jgi:phage shock protein PspC (stress-responsive transcriptional regulator)
VLGGVCSGISAYFDIDSIWLRLAFVILAVFAFGSGVLAYIILWAIIPEAKTASEKLQMRGERVNIANIEKECSRGVRGLKREARFWQVNWVQRKINKPRIPHIQPESR